MVFLRERRILTGKVAEEIYRPSPIAKDVQEILLSEEFKISDQNLERMREIMELNYIQISVDSFEIGDKKQLGIFLSRADTKRRTNHDGGDDDDYDDDTKDDDDCTDDVGCID